MRKKTDEKRETIIAAASEVFREVGFERASMSDIRAKVGGSKATLYNYFSSKEELFLEVMMLSKKAQFDIIHQAIDSTEGDIEDSLLQFGEKLLTFIYSSEILSFRRLFINEATRSNIGKSFYDRGKKQADLLVAEFLKKNMDAGKLRQEDPQIVTLHLLGLLESELIEYLYYNPALPLSALKIKNATARAIDIFLRAYRKK